jgi:TolB-like protein/Flp pilus assembly protein TadD
MTPDIFLSYTREDQATAQRFAEGFEAQGLSVWWDATLRPGETFDEVTEAALREAKAVVVLWSPRSISSRWVRAEAAIADRNKTLMPVTIEQCNRPVMFELTQTADLSHWAGEATDPAWRAFLGDVRRFVEAGLTPPPAAKAAPPPSQRSRPSIAVLPFINRSGADADDVFADCMAEDLTAALSASQRLNVVAASATSLYRMTGRDLREIGRDLDARYLLEGNVRRVGEGLRVTAQLVEAESGRLLWTQKFERLATELSTLQDDLASEVAAHLGVQLYRAEVEHALRKPRSGSAWDALIRSLAHSTHATRSGWEAAVAEAQQAVAFDPENGEVCAFLASAQGQLWRMRGGDDPELARAAINSARQARTLDPDNPTVLCLIAWALACLGNLQEALPLAERAVCESRLYWTHSILGAILARLGRSDEALAQLDEAERLGPNNSSLYYEAIWRALALLRAGRIQQALDAADWAVGLRPGAEALVLSMLCLAKVDRLDRARDTLNRLREADPDLSRTLVESLVRDFYGGANAADEYLAIVGKLWDEAASQAGSP